MASTIGRGSDPFFGQSPQNGTGPARSTRTRSSRPRRGLTLFEVLLALFIFCGAMAALGQLVSNGVRSAVRARLQTQAMLRCESKLAEIVGGIEPLQAAQGTAFPDDRAWTWGVQVLPGPYPDVMLITVTVDHTAKSNMGKVTTSLTRLLRDPQIYLDSSADAMQESETEE